MIGGLISLGAGAVLAVLLAFTGASLVTNSTPDPISAPLVSYGSR